MTSGGLHNFLTHNLSPHNLLTHNLLTHNLLTHNLLTHNLSPHFAWQAWHLVTSTFTSRRRRGTWWHRPSFRVAGVALGDMDVHFAWQAWHLWHWAGSGGALGSRGRRGSLRGRRGTWRHGPWQAWHLVTSTFTLRRRRGTWWHGPSLRVAGVALGDIDLHFASQAWHLVTWTCTLRGRRGTYGTGLALVARLVPVGAAALCVAGVALGDMDRGTWWHRPSLCVAGVALGDMELHFASQAWHLVTWTCTLRGRRGTYGTGLALVARLVPVLWCQVKLVTGL